jgi:hypothetical protein
MKHALFLAGFALALAAPAAVQGEAASAPQLNSDQELLLRCSAVFGIIASDQARGIESARAYPPLAVRGREYFVRAGARLIDELGLTDEQVRAMVNQEVQTLQAQSAAAADPAIYVDTIMQACLVSLEASGL